MSSRDLPLALGYWIVSHKATLRRWWAIVLLVVIVLSTFWIFASLAVFFSQEPKLNQRLLTSVRLIGALTPARIGQPAALTTGQATIIPRAAGRGDIVGTLTNPNTEWGASTVRFHFTVGGVSTPITTVAVNPGERRSVAALNVGLVSQAPAQLVIDTVNWTRGTGADLKQLFVVDKVSWTPTRVSIQGTTVQTVTVQATIRNDSVYNYYHVEVPVVVKAGETIVAVDELRLDRWASRSTKTVTVSWPYQVTGVTAVELTPTVNQFDPSNRF